MKQSYFFAVFLIFAALAFAQFGMACILLRSLHLFHSGSLGHQSMLLFFPEAWQALHIFVLLMACLIQLGMPALMHAEALLYIRSL